MSVVLKFPVGVRLAWGWFKFTLGRVWDWLGVGLRWCSGWFRVDLRLV